MRASLSILALYNFDNTLFDNMTLPEGVEKEVVVNNLLMELAELEVIYASAPMMKTAIGFWSAKELPVWEKLFATTQLEYNPIFNQFRTENWTDTQTRNLSQTDNETRNLTATNNEERDLNGTNDEYRDLSGGGTHHSETAGTTQNNGTDIQKEYVSAFNETNAPTLSKQTEQILGAGNTVGGSVDSTDNSTDTGTVNRDTTEAGTIDRTMTDTGTVNNSISDTGTVENVHTAEFEGHTGLVPVQKLIEMERQVVQFNMANHIIDSFKSRFCLLVY